MRDFASLFEKVTRGWTDWVPSMPRMSRGGGPTVRCQIMWHRGAPLSVEKLSEDLVPHHFLSWISQGKPGFWPVSCLALFATFERITVLQNPVELTVSLLVWLKLESESVASAEPKNLTAGIINKYLPVQFPKHLFYQMSQLCPVSVEWSAIMLLNVSDLSKLTRLQLLQNSVRRALGLFERDTRCNFFACVVKGVVIL